MRDDYTARINRVLDHIEAHLAEPLKLADLARVAAFSPFLFSRLFAALVGEPPGQFISRLRLERAAGLLIGNPRAPVTDIALDVGFASPSTFARAFKDQFGLTASEWREADPDERKIGKADRKMSEAVSNLREALDISVAYGEGNTGYPTWRMEMTTATGSLKAHVEIHDLPDTPVVYLRHTGPYMGDSALFERLWGQMMQWAGPRGLFRPPETQMITVYHDNPDLTDEDKLRLSICLSVPDGTEVDGEFGTMTVPGGRYAIARFELNPAQYSDAWAAVYAGWLPESGYQPDDRVPFERCPSDQKCDGDTHVVEICVPVKPL